MQAAMVIGGTVTCHVQKRGEKQEHLGLELGHTCSTRTCTAAPVRARPLPHEKVGTGQSRGGVRDSGENRGGDGASARRGAGDRAKQGAGAHRQLGGSNLRVVTRHAKPVLRCRLVLPASPLFLCDSSVARRTCAFRCSCVRTMRGKQRPLRRRDTGGR
jgi:hypothetical protein